MIDPTVRAATPADAGQLSELDAEARAALVDQRGGARWLAQHAPFEWGARSHVAVAHIGDVLVGYVVLAVAGKVARIESVYVTPGARELGFGDALLAWALDAARSAGSRWLEAEALPGDRETKNLYERAGIKARLITVSTELK